MSEKNLPDAGVIWTGPTEKGSPNHWLIFKHPSVGQVRIETNGPLDQETFKALANIIGAIGHRRDPHAPSRGENN